VLLSGGGALIHGMTTDLNRRLGLEVEMIDPFKKITCNKSILDKEAEGRLGPIAAVGVGLALRNVGDKA